MHRFIRWAAFFAASVLLLTGCEMPFGGPEKLTLTEVVKKAEAKSKNGNGSVFKVKGEQELTLEANGRSQGMKQSLEADMEVTNRPPAFHITGSVEGGGESGEMEMYQVGKEIYQNMDDETWVKSEGADLNQMTGGQTQNPSEALQKIEELLSRIKKTEKQDALKMKETKKHYIITLNVTHKTNREIRENFMKQLTAGLVPAIEQAGLNLDEKDIRLKKLVQVYHIDKQTFQHKQMEQTMILEFPVDDGTTQGNVRVEQKMTADHAGELDGAIEVPQDVKENAREVDSSL